jgi:hypothetical protein|tara:strand:- start:292 stop:675 length:384 start_codon:yes stop_codon:yes gene_type:complete
MRIIILLFFYIIFISSIAKSETWVCAYEINSEAKIIKLVRTEKGFRRTSEYSSEFVGPMYEKILSENDRRIILTNVYDESVYIRILDKINSEFVHSGVHALSILRRGGADLNNHKFVFNHGKCEVLH